MTREELIHQIKGKQSYLCVGLDTDIQKIPDHLRFEPDPIFAFNREIIDATLPYAVAYKPNLAFYEALGASGWESLRKTLNYLPSEIFTIADAKRGDIGNTSSLYARAFFETLNFDSITVAPYMGEDSVKPFLAFRNKWVILLAHTSNVGALDFQTMETVSGRPLYEEVILKASQWGNPGNLMFVVGATQTERISHIRQLAPEYFFLVPGIGAQGGDLEHVSNAACTKDIGILVNASRSILYASSGADFGTAAAAEARQLQQQMAPLIVKES